MHTVYGEPVSVDAVIGTAMPWWMVATTVLARPSARSA